MNKNGKRLKKLQIIVYQGNIKSDGFPKDIRKRMKKQLIKIHTGIQ